MFFKLSFRNVRRSMKDYAIYFLTLMFGVCIFYVFNSVQAQQSMLEVSEVQTLMLQNLSMLLGYVSVFVSIILGFLIIYANKFLIKRRKRELGLYMLLGMEKGSISRILICETLFIGVISLLVGLLIGTLLSQGLAVVTAKMFAVRLKSFSFAFSSEACLKTILYFGIIYLLVMVFNSVSISKCKLISLLNAHKQNEKFKMKKLWMSVVLFLLAVGCLGTAYFLICKNKLLTINLELTASIVLGMVGTLLFFMSLSGFLLRLVKSSRRIYLKNLNMFVLRQINSKINTTYLSMTVICLLLFVAILTLSTGMSMASIMTKDLEETTPYDASITYKLPEGETDLDLIADAQQYSDLSFAQQMQQVSYRSDPQLTYQELIKGGMETLSNQYSLDRFASSFVPVIGISDYNHLMELQGKRGLDLAENAFAINCNFDEVFGIFNYYLGNVRQLTVGGIELTAAMPQVVENTIDLTGMKMDTGTLIVPDEVAVQLPIVSKMAVFQYGEDKDQAETEFSALVEQSDHFQFSDTKLTIYQQMAGSKTMLSYIAIYLGIVFLLTSAAVLALQQLSESADNLERYGLLRKIGVEPRMINRSLLAQIAIYFFIPLALALVHSAVGVFVISQLLKQFGEMDITGNVIATVVSLIVIYGAYFLATYLGSKTMIRERGSE